MVSCGVFRPPAGHQCIGGGRGSAHWGNWGFIPKISGPGAEWKNGLAWALIGGLTSSIFLTSLLAPVVYVKADRWKERFPILLSHPRQLLGWGPKEAGR